MLIGTTESRGGAGVSLRMGGIAHRGPQWDHVLLIHKRHPVDYFQVFPKESRVHPRGSASQVQNGFRADYAVYNQLALWVVEDYAHRLVIRRLYGDLLGERVWVDGDVGGRV